MGKIATHTYLPDGRIITTYKEVPDQSNSLAVTPKELIDISHKGGGVLQTIGKTYVVKESAEYREAHPEEFGEDPEEKISPKLAEGISGYYAKSSSGVYVPITESTAQKITRDIESQAAQAKTTISNVIIPNTFNISQEEQEKLYQNVDYSKFPQLNVTAKYDSLQPKPTKITPESIGEYEYYRIESLRATSGFQLAQLAEKAITWEGVTTLLQAGLTTLSGEYDTFKKNLQTEWEERERMDAYRMLYGNKDQLLLEKGVILGTSAATTIIPQFSGKILSVALAKKAISQTTAMNIGKLMLVGTGITTAYGTSMMASNFYQASQGNIEAGRRFGLGAIVTAFSAYGMKKAWETAFPKKYPIYSYTTEYQTYSGERVGIEGEFPASQMKEKMRYGSSLEKLPKTTKHDTAIYAEIRGYKNIQMYTGDIHKQPFDLKVRFRIEEKTGLYKPLIQNIGEIDVFYPTRSGETIRNLGIGYFDTSIGKPDIYHPFTFEKQGVTWHINIEDWERQFKTLPHDIAISKNLPFYEGGGYDIFRSDFESILQKMVGGKDIVVTKASYEAFFIEPELRKAFDVFRITSKKSPSWITTGDYYIPNEDVFKVIGLGKFDIGEGITIDTKGGKLLSTEVMIGEAAIDKAKVMDIFTGYSRTMYDKPVYVLANYPPSIAASFPSQAFYGMSDTKLNQIVFSGGKGDLGLQPELRQQPKMEVFFEPKLKEIPYSMPQLKTELRQQPLLQPELKIIQEAKLQPLLQPELRQQLKMRMQLRTEMRMQLQPKLRLDIRKEIPPIIRFEERKGGLDFKIKKEPFRFGKFKRKGREMWKIEPKADWLSRIESEMLYGKATNVPKSKKYRKAFLKEFQSPMGLFAGRFPTKEMIIFEKIKI